MDPPAQGAEGGLSPQLALALQGALRVEWVKFRSSLDKVLAEQLQRNEQLVAGFLTVPAPSEDSAVEGESAASASTDGVTFRVLSRHDDEDSGDRTKRSLQAPPQVPQERTALAPAERGAAASGACLSPAPSVTATSHSRRRLSCISGISAREGDRSTAERQRRMSRIHPSAGSPALRGQPMGGAAQLLAIQDAVNEVKGGVDRIEKNLEERKAVGGVQSQRMMLRRANNCNLDGTPHMQERAATRSPWGDPFGDLPHEHRGRNTMRRMDINTEPRAYIAEILETSRTEISSGFIRKGLLKWFGSTMRWIDSLKEPERTGCVADVVNSRWFETLCALVIVLNGIFTWASTDYEIHTFQSGSEPTPLMNILDLAFVLFYTLELALKLFVHRLYFFCSMDWRWNLFDCVLVVSSLIDEVLSEISGSGNSGNGNIVFMRALRVLKMAKILRGLRVVRFIEELRLIVNSLLGSMASLWWSIVMLLLVFYMFSLVFVQAAAMHLSLEAKSPDPENEDKFSEVLKYFGSVLTAMLSLFQSVAGGDDWVNFYTAIAITGWPYALLFVFFIAFSQIAILNVLTAIFVNNAMELARPDADKLALEKRRKDIAAYEELCYLSREMAVEGEDGEDTITFEVFKKHIEGGRVGARLSVLGLQVSDAAAFFELLTFTVTTGSGEASQQMQSSKTVSVPDFVQGCMLLRGSATGIGVQGVLHEAKHIYILLNELRKETKATDRLVRSLYQELMEIDY